MIQLPPMPPQIERLPRDERGYPCPWFITWIDGKPEFRVADGRKMIQAIQQQLCWVCGTKMHLKNKKQDFAFVLGPMCSINRVNSEPPSHYECAVFSAMACPFLTKPKAVRRDACLPAGTTDPAGEFIERNPGACAVWRCQGYELFEAGNGFLFSVGEPTEVRWFAEGRQATRDEVLASIESGLPILMEKARQDNAEAVLLKMRDDVLKYMPFDECV